MIFAGLLAFIPISLALKYLVGSSALIVFATSSIAIAGLAEWIRRSTDQLADRVGSSIGGLLTISFGSIAELVLALFVLMRGQVDVVQAQIAGSILATSLLGLGLAIIVGGATRARQLFKPERAGLLSSLLILVVIALLLPAVFDLTGRVSGNAAALGVTDEEVSLGVAVVLLLLYLANLSYTLVTHRDVFSADKPEGGSDWSLSLSLAVLVGATAAIALEAELLSAALEDAAGSLHLSPMFLGVIVLAIVGTAGDLFAESWFAHEDRMGLVLQICNVLVCLAVWLSIGARTTSDKVLAVLFPVSAFVAAGFEHSVANMYLIPLGLMIQEWGPEALAQAARASAAGHLLTWPRFLWSLVPVTLGNMIGGGLLVGGVYWFVYLRPRRRP